jgi:hypothetical protein
LIFIGCAFTAKSQNLDLLPKTKRDSLLITVAKEIVLKYGSGYYREYKEPIVKRNQEPPKGTPVPIPYINETRYTTGEMAGRVIYSVTFLYDETKELLEKDFAARVSFWGDTGSPTNVQFGNGLIRLIPETGYESDEAGEQFIYQQREVMPIYDLNHPERIEPINIDELRRRGYVKKENESWVKETRDIPPVY